MAKRISAEQFLDLAKEKFENKFEYDLEDFKNMRSKINVFCSSRDHFGVPHGWFATSAEVHLRGDGGCKTCQYSKGEYLCRNKDDFVYWGNKFHKGKYDYSEFIYVDGKTKGLIKCDIDGHKPFLMHPNNHLSRKAGCPECGKTQAGANLSKNRHGGVSLTKRLLNEGPKIYKKKFDYSLINPDKELRIKDFVQVICPRHGAFEVQISVHLAGHDCLKCTQEESGAKRRRDQEEFINECKERWGHSDEYYSKVNYIGGAYPITLVCPEHGDFKCNSAKSHRQRGDGCQVCSGNQKKDRDEIIRLCIEKHGDTYDYSMVQENIKAVHDKITIVCNIHGPFKQSAVGHYNLGYGCPGCGLMKSGLDNIKAFTHDEKRAQSYCELYLVSVGEYFKIGIAEDTYKRDEKYYDEYILILPSKRAICWVAEQYLLLQTAWLEPQHLPNKYKNWPGRSELRRRELEIDELIDYMEVVMAEAEEIGWIEFAQKHKLPDYGYGWDPESGL